MKKIITLFFAVALFSVAAFAQRHSSNYDNGYNSYNNNGYNSYNSNSYGYATPYGNSWNNDGYSNQFDRHDRDRDDWFYRDAHRHRSYEDRRFYDRDDRFRRSRKGISLQLVFGGRSRF